MNAIKIRVEKCCDHDHWLVKHDNTLLSTAINQPHAITIADYWIRSFKEFKP